MEYKEMLQKAYHKSSFKNTVSYEDYELVGMFLAMHVDRALRLRHLPKIKIGCFGTFTPLKVTVNRAITRLKEAHPERIERIAQLEQALLPKQLKNPKRKKK